MEESKESPERDTRRSKKLDVNVSVNLGLIFDIGRGLRKILRDYLSPSPMTVIVFSRLQNSETGLFAQGEIYMASAKVGQTLAFEVKAKTRSGRPGRFEAGTLSYSSSDENVATVAQDPSDQTKGTVTCMGEGDALISFTGDGDSSSGSKPIQGSGAISVLPEDVIGADMVFADPVDPADAPPVEG